jgi:hypothetical protein
MQLKGSDLNDVYEDLLLCLIKDQVAGDRHLEFKEKLEVTTDKRRKDEKLIDYTMSDSYAADSRQTERGK